MFGVGLPVAVQTRLTSVSSLTAVVMGGCMITGGTIRTKDAALFKGD